MTGFSSQLNGQSFMGCPRTLGRSNGTKTMALFGGGKKGGAGTKVLKQAQKGTQKATQTLKKGTQKKGPGGAAGAGGSGAYRKYQSNRLPCLSNLEAHACINKAANLQNPYGTGLHQYLPLQGSLNEEASPIRFNQDGVYIGCKGSDITSHGDASRFFPVFELFRRQMTIWCNRYSLSLMTHAGSVLNQGDM